MARAPKTARPSKVVSHPAQVARDTLVANLQARIAVQYPNWSKTRVYERLVKATGHSLSSIQRMMSAETGPSIDTVANVAHHLGVTMQALFEPLPGPLPRFEDRRKQG